MFSSSSPPSSPHIPILLLKSPSPSSHEDAYATHFPPPQYKPHFLPPLHNIILPPPPSLIAALATTPPLSPSYIALVFTSQRAVSAFAAALAASASSSSSSSSSSADSANVGDGVGAPSRAELLAQLRLPLYAVGPATARALRVDVQAVWLRACWVVGEEAGRGEVLAGLMVRDLLPRQRPADGDDGEEIEGDTETGVGAGRKIGNGVLFVTGETRRDVVPRALRQAGISVEEAVVYATAVDPLFENAVRETVAVHSTDEGIGIHWVVIFSPQGSRELLRALGWLDEEIQGTRTGRLKAGVMSDVGRRTYMASIGPMTGEYLEQEFGLRVDVQAGRPSPEGVREGLKGFMRQKGWVRW